jgi:hypothetical protein
MPTYDPLLLLQCDSQEVKPEWRYVAHNISKVFGLGQHLLPVDDEEVVALPHQALHVVLEGQVKRKRDLFSAPSGISQKKYDQSIKLIEKVFLHFARALKNNQGLTNSVCNKYNHICSWVHADL